MKLLFYFILFFTTSFIFSQNTSFSYQGSQLEINSHLSKQDKQVLDSIDQSKEIWIDLRDEANQEDLIYICKKFSNIGNLSIEINDKLIKNLDPLKNIIKLKKLSIENGTAKNSKIDLATLRAFNTLESIKLTFFDIDATTPLSVHENLKEIFFSGTEVNSLDFLKSTKNLTSLRLGGVVKDYSPIGTLKKLKTLSLSIKNKDLRFLNNLEKLENLDFAFANKITSFKNLKNCKNLRNLNVRNCENLIDISTLKENKNLEYINLEGAKSLSNISSLSSCINLKILDLKRTAITDLSPLNTLKNLTQLYIAYTKIKNIKPLNKLEKLTFITLPITATNWKPLYKIKHKLSIFVDQSFDQSIIDKAKKKNSNILGQRVHYSNL